MLTTSGIQYWERMTFGVENDAVEWQQIGIVGEEQIEVLQRLGKPERGHLVAIAGISIVLHVVDGGVTFLQLRVLLERLKYAPAPRTILLVAREPVEVEQTLHCLGPQQIVRIGRLDITRVYVSVGRHMHMQTDAQINMHMCAQNKSIHSSLKSDRNSSQLC